MATDWNDPFETLVDTIVNDFGEYLFKQNQLSLAEQMRTREVCRDFCIHLCKDLHKASKQDYELYLRMHSSTSEAEEDYRRILGYIRAFSEEVAERSLNTKLQPQEPELEQGIRPKARTLHTMKRNVTTFEFEPSKELLDELLFSESKFQGTGMGSAQRRRGDAKETPAQPSASVTLSKETQIAPKSEAPGRRLPSLSLALDQFDFSLDQVLSDAGSVEAAAENAAQQDNTRPGLKVEADPDLSWLNNPKNSLHLDSVLYEGFGQQSGGPFDKSLFSIDSFKLNRSLEEQDSALSSNSPAKSPARPQTLPQQQASLRSVEGIQYDLEAPQLKSLHSPLEERRLQQEQQLQLQQGLYKGKYRIEHSLPQLDRFQVIPRSFWRHIAYPLVPSIVCFALSALAFIIHPLICALVLALALALLVYSLPDLKAPAQQTPYVTLAVYLSARRGRCYHIANALCVQELGEESPDFAELWLGDQGGFFSVLRARFEKARLPELSPIMGSESQNAYVMLYETPEGYCDLRFVRIQGRWYLCDPKMAMQA